ncbi:hypothetical protein JCGZ_03603 [Jatropha curcas]|uniref:Uncharacterized protein n=1 Tax=Jatropha curcas TaxID=180498 RepID=A0A067JQ03_JATCU|nr:hypothetical protein JCGZ_03603 [Jatropha curcas]
MLLGPLARKKVMQSGDEAAATVAPVAPSTTIATTDVPSTSAARQLNIEARLHNLEQRHTEMAAMLQINDDTSH